MTAAGACHGGGLQGRLPKEKGYTTMKPLRLIATPTRNRRVNEVLGMMVLVAAALLLLALISYAPADPSFNTVGSHAVAGGRAVANWAGMLGAYTADGLLQVLGVASFLLPVLLGRVGVCWVLSRPAGSGVAKWLGLMLWVVFAPAAVALGNLHMLWRGALPLSGVSGRLVADMLVALLNVPGAAIVVALMVVLSLYLATTFAFNTAREWVTAHFAFVAAMRARRNARKLSAEAATSSVDAGGEVFGAKREKVEQAARREAARAEKLAAREANGNTLLGGSVRVAEQAQGA